MSGVTAILVASAAMPGCAADTDAAHDDVHTAKLSELRNTDPKALERVVSVAYGNPS